MSGVPGFAEEQPIRVQIYSRPECHLCAAARSVVAEVCAQAGAAWEEIDITGSPQLVNKYADYVPVVLVDGVQQAFWRVEGARLARALRRTA